VFADAEYPAADFQPKVLFSANESASSSTSASSAVEQTTIAIEEADAEYPAANFQPKVLFFDTAYKPSATVSKESTPVSAASPSKTVSIAVVDRAPVAAISSAPVSQENVATDMPLILLGLLALLGAGYWYKQKNCACHTRTADRVLVESGVARYLAARDKPAMSGVAKYIAKQAEAKATGVENYLRNRS
jgi:hypothetical protein